MNKIIHSLIIMALIVPSVSAFGQKCNPEELHTKPGNWKAGMGGSVRGIAPADLAKSKSVLAAIHKMISTGYNPVGCEANYSNAFSPSEHFVSNPYSYSIHVLRYLCEPDAAAKKNWYVDYATPTTVRVTANVIYSLSNLNAGDLRDDFRGYLKLDIRPEKKEGVYYMGEKVVTYQQSSPNIEYRWLITYGDKLPFRYLSRKEYLALLKTKLLKNIKESPTEQEYFGKFLNNINEYLKRPESDLSKDAICMWNQEERFENFVDEGTKGSFIAVVPDMTYYKTGVPKGAPQFFTVIYTLTKNDPVFEDNISRIQKAIDFNVLRNMLGK